MEPAPLVECLMQVALDEVSSLVYEVKPVAELALDMQEELPPIEHFGFEVVSRIVVPQPLHALKQEGSLSLCVVLLGLSDVLVIVALVVHKLLDVPQL